MKLFTALSDHGDLCYRVAYIHLGTNPLQDDTKCAPDGPWFAVDLHKYGCDSRYISQISMSWLLQSFSVFSVCFPGGPSAWSSSHCECCCKSQKSEREGESGTSFNELSTSCSETQSEASSPQETVIARPVSQQHHHHIQTLERTVKKGPAQAMQTETRRRTELLRTRTTGPRDLMTPSKRKPAKEKLTPEQELQKCIQDFRRIRIPERFPNRKNTWQSDLLRKYHLWSENERSGKRRRKEQGRRRKHNLPISA